MAIGVKVMNRPLERVSYIRATLNGMAVTLKHLVDPHKVTMQYPETKWDLSPRWRGTHRMLTDETGKAKCVACGLCAVDARPMRSTWKRRRTTAP